MNLITKPMLSATLKNVDTLKFPVAVTPKLDGIRCLRVGGKTLSRTFKPIPNLHIQAMMSTLPDGLDGELMIKDGTFNQVQSGVMREDGTPDFEFWVFDYVSTTLDEPYTSRMVKLGSLALPTFCKKVLPWIANNIDELNTFETMVLSQGYEGAMVRSLTSPYKAGRATEREGYLSKLKRFEDSEAVVIGFEEQLTNMNEATKDAFGRTERSSHKENMIPNNTLGKFLVREVSNTPWKGQEFAVGTGEGLTAALRKSIWDAKEQYLGKIITYKYQPHGVKDLPRLPIWKGFRSEDDMS
jgi:DNA ligase-1